MRQAEFLKKNGTIGFVAPSFGCNIEPYRSAFEAAQQKFRELGHSLKIGPNCYEGSGIGISNTPEKCGEEINAFFADTSVDVLLSCGGGELMCEILDYVDFERIAAGVPKWFMGYSDNTNLTFLLPTLCDTMAVYAPCAPAFGMREWHPAIQDAYDVLCGKKAEIQGYPFWEKESLKDEEHPLEPYHVTEPRVLRILTADGVIMDGLEAAAGRNMSAEIKMRGRLIGGCLDCLGNLVGTKYDRVVDFAERYQEDGLIWFLESCDLNLMSIRRTLWQLSHADWFRHVRGFLIGRPLCFGSEEFGIDHYQAFMEALKPYRVPVIMDVDIGHLPPMMPVVSGGLADVKTVGNDLVLKYDFR